MNFDRALIQFDRALRIVSGQTKANRVNPAKKMIEDILSKEEVSHSAGLMRVNHVGEICAQALYDSQAVFAQTPIVRKQLAHSSIEEEDHLAWTAERLKELNSHTSFLNPLWYMGAFSCGLIAGRCGDAISLGFVVETEKQVEDHLQNHLQQLPINDKKSRAIVDQMRIDEIAHGAAANALGAKPLPPPIKIVMKGMAKVMTSTAYYI